MIAQIAVSAAVFAIDKPYDYRIPEGMTLVPGLRVRAGRPSCRSGAATRGQWEPAAELPVARIAVDVPLAHLDRPFDYRVPAHLDAAAVPGVRLRVRFAGRLVDGFLLERLPESSHDGALAWVERVVSPEPGE